MATELYPTVPDELAEWLAKQDHLGPSALLQKAIHDAQQEASVEPESIEYLASLTLEDAEWLDEQPYDLSTFVGAKIAEERRAADGEDTE